MKNERKRDMRLLALLLVFLLFFISSYLATGERVSDSQVLERFELVWHKDTLSLVSSGGIPDGPDIPGSVYPLLFRKIPVNNAEALLLETIPGVGPGLAQRIVDDRLKSGRYHSPDDLLRVAGIGRKRKEILQERLSFD